VTYAPGTKAVIAARLLVRSAPGVSWMSWPLTMVVGVTSPACGPDGVPLTVTDCDSCATRSCTCRIGVVPGTTVSRTFAGSKPSSVTSRA
jgi:hypothetical protein